ncbi:transcriptional regulator [Rhizobium sp. J15]|uniref:GAF domain-containing protein n=1 Tax=Rhizobium sp. J15 TaxID=2035450 RepID=UPI000BE7F54C|nr:GAF domain-containing protein [Rhizobium sp. J15]PDT15576.1 transcriptional regulator [Rhizobium sp. J15]
MIPLEGLRDSFEGVIPSIIATTDADGMPNISYLSHVHYVDERHVALSNQFFSKTADNVARNGLATVMVVDGYSGQQHVLDLVFERSETEGETFDQLAIHLAILESRMSGIMKLHAVDIYRVEDCRAVPAANPLVEPEPLCLPDLMGRVARLTARMSNCGDPETLLDATLEGLSERFGYSNSMVLVPDGERDGLTTIASRGYDQFGFGAEVAAGRGIIGLAAERRRTVRITDLSRGRRYIEAVRAMAGVEDAAPIPLPALEKPLSQIALPLVARGRLVGVLFSESTERFTFRHRDEEALIVIAAHLATALSFLSEERERAETNGREKADAPADRAGATPAGRRIAVRFYPRDGSLFVDDDYLIRGVPGRLLLHFLEDYVRTGKQDFLNREIRRDRRLQLPDFKDNLETRLILLRRRLEEKAGPITLDRADRGRLRLTLAGWPEIEVVEE